MRIISGKFKKRNLLSVPGNTSRPTTAFIREMIFSALHDVSSLTVLDLFAGSGSFGFEALSRNALSVSFVDSSEKAFKTIFSNIRLLNCSEDVIIHKKIVTNFLRSCQDKFDLIFMDPPYQKGLINDTISLIFERNLLAEDGVLIIECSEKDAISEYFNSYIVNEKHHGQTAIYFLKMKSSGD
ncbi:MAG: 16S rRNA (guanine(966)-N(2))-methyltransferase RsmD [Candidatus Cloacimonetes bacterium]|nr:16S rRNA (guanine(966)-N(2))-methyltransferase RsmD [Candidatus Cloacimonadota bacterium]